MKKLLALILVGCSILGLFGCGKGGDKTDGDEHKITIYRYMDLGLGEGTEDEAVERAIAEKFYQDTGIKIRLDVKMYSHSELQTKVDTNWTKRSADMDGVLHYVSEDYGCATLRYATSSDTVKDLEPLVEQYGPNIKNYMGMDDENANRRMSHYVNNDGEFKMNYLIATHNDGPYGLLVRKDYMKAVQDVTGLDPEDFDVMNDGYRSMTITEFNDLLYALRDEYDKTEMKYPIIGAPWDINYTLANSLGADCYSIQYDADGRYAPAQFSPQVAEYYDMLQRWSYDGVWESEAANVADSQRRGWFIAGQAAVYAAAPTAENVITTKRYLEQQNPMAEYMVIAPLATKDGVVNGYTNTWGPDGLIIPEKADDAEVLIQYIDWLYSDVENYELAQYGIKGTHWVEGDDRTVNGKTYKTWLYPDAKAEEYSVNTPYQGRYNLLENVNISNRVRGDYNTMEFTWYHNIVDGFPVYHSNKVEGFWIGNCPRDYKAQFNSIDGNYVEHVRSYAWAGIYRVNPDTGEQETCSETLADYIATRKIDAKGYLDWLNDYIATAKAFKLEKFGV